MSSPTKRYMGTQPFHPTSIPNLDNTVHAGHWRERIQAENAARARAVPIKAVPSFLAHPQSLQEAPIIRGGGRRERDVSPVKAARMEQASLQERAEMFKGKGLQHSPSERGFQQNGSGSGDSQQQQRGMSHSRSDGQLLPALSPFARHAQVGFHFGSGQPYPVSREELQKYYSPPQQTRSLASPNFLAHAEFNASPAKQWQQRVENEIERYPQQQQQQQTQQRFEQRGGQQQQQDEYVPSHSRGRQSGGSGGGRGGSGSGSVSFDDEQRQIAYEQRQALEAEERAEERQQQWDERERRAARSRQEEQKEPDYAQERFEEDTTQQQQQQHHSRSGSQQQPQQQPYSQQLFSVSLAPEQQSSLHVGTSSPSDSPSSSAAAPAAAAYTTSTALAQPHAYLAWSPSSGAKRLGPTAVPLAASSPGGSNGATRMARPRHPNAQLHTGSINVLHYANQESDALQKGTVAHSTFSAGGWQSSNPDDIPPDAGLFRSNTESRDNFKSPPKELYGQHYSRQQAATHGQGSPLPSVHRSGVLPSRGVALPPLR